MAEQIIDIRERIEKMRIKFDDDDKNNFNDEKKDASWIFIQSRTSCSTKKNWALVNGVIKKTEIFKILV